MGVSCGIDAGALPKLYGGIDLCGSTVEDVINACGESSCDPICGEPLRYYRCLDGQSAKLILTYPGIREDEQAGFLDFGQRVSDITIFTFLEYADPGGC